MAVLGPGLIGGSVLKCVRAVSPGVKLRVWGRRREVLDQVAQEGLADLASTDIAEVVSGADLIVLAMPVEYMAETVGAFPALSGGGKKVIVTDVGSVKDSVLNELEPLVGEKGGLFVGSHPMAGSEKTGLEFATAELFEGAAVIVTRDRANECSNEIKAVADFWTALGGVVSVMDARRHDQVVAAISHLPHIVASALARAVFENDEQSLPFAAGGFRDTTRIASGPADMWSGILTNNREAVLQQLDQYMAGLAEWRAALESQDREKLRNFLTRAGECREKV